jgi:transcriptional regulator with XRE-family HTH domain
VVEQVEDENGLGQSAKDPTYKDLTSEDPVLKAFGTRLRRLAKARGLTQAQIAEQLGVDPGRVAHWWRGENGPKIHHLGALADVLDVSVDVLLGRGFNATRLVEQEENLAELVRLLREDPESRLEIKFRGPRGDHRVISLREAILGDEKTGSI